MRLHRAGRDALLLALAAAAAYLAALQHTVYGDGAFLLSAVADGDLFHPHHLAYKWLVHGVWRALAPCGATLYGAVVGCSAVGSGIGVGAGYVGLRVLGVGRGRAVAAALAAAAAPAMVFFATVVELHGVFAGFAGLAFAAAAWLARAPSTARALVFGSSTFAAYTMHATGHLLLAAYGAVVLGSAWASGAGARGRACLLLGCAVAAHAVLVLGLRWFLHVPGENQPLDLFRAYFAVYDYRIATALRTVVADLVVAFAPLSLAWLAAFSRRDARPVAALFSCVTVVYLTVTFLLTNGNTEHGAYLLPLVWPMAFLAASACSWAILLVAAAIGGTVAAVMVARHDDRSANLAFADGLRATVDPREAVLVCSDGADLHAVLIELPGVRHVLLRVLVTLPEAVHVQALAAVEARLVELLQKGKRVFLTDAAERLLASPEFGRLYPLAPRLLARLEAAFELVACDRDGFRAREVRQRPGSGR